MDVVQMTELLGNLGEFLGSVGVLVTLVYLSLQVRHGKEAIENSARLTEQNNRLALTQNQLARVDLIQQQVRDLALSDDLAAIFIKRESEGYQSLNEVERRRYQSWQIIQHYLLDSQHYQHELGMLDEDSWQDAVRRIRMSIPIWDDCGVTSMEIGRSSFRAEVERIRQAGA